MNFLILAKFFLYSIEGANFRFDFCFWKFPAQIPKFTHFGPKSMNFVILNEILSQPNFEGADFKSDFSFRIFKAKSSNMGILDQKVLTF